jgi:hypothetical protein
VAASIRGYAAMRAQRPARARIAERAERRVARVENVLDVGEHLEVFRDRVGAMEVNDRVAGQGRILVGFVAAEEPVAHIGHGAADRLFWCDPAPRSSSAMPASISAGRRIVPFNRTWLFRGFDASSQIGQSQGLAVYQNGVRINEAFGGSVNWDLVPEFAINCLSLITGSPVFGLNALGGALAIEMKNGFNFQGGQAEVSGGSFGRREGVLEYGVKAGNFASYIGGRALSASFVIDGATRLRAARNLVRRTAESACGIEIDRTDLTQILVLGAAEEGAVAFWVGVSSYVVADFLLYHGSAPSRNTTLALSVGSPAALTGNARQWLADWHMRPRKTSIGRRLDRS